MNGAARELRRPWCYLVAVLVAASAMVAGLPWGIGVAIAVAAFTVGIAAAAWVGGRPERDPDGPDGPSRSPIAAMQPSLEADDPVFRLEGEFWTIHYHAETFRLHDAKGLRYLHRLLERPGAEMHVLDLVADGSPSASGHPSAGEELTVGSPSEPMLDRQARETLKRKVDDLRDQIEEARANADFERAAVAREELETITDYLGQQLRADGASRNIVDAAERARVNVTRSIHTSIAKIDTQDAALGHHLDRDIRTGTYCAYLPDPTATPHWRL